MAEINQESQQKEFVENTWTVTIISNGIGAFAGVIASQIAEAAKVNPTISAGLAFAKVSIVSSAAETLTVAIAIQSEDPDRIGSASLGAVGSLAGSLIAAGIVGSAGVGITLTAVAIGGIAGSYIGKEIWQELVGHSSIVPIYYNDEKITDFYTPTTTITGHDYGETLTGTDSDDFISGLGGDDTILGGNGNDRLLGGDGEDLITGGNGNDFISGGAGFDYLDGGYGDDIINGNDDSWRIAA